VNTRKLVELDYEEENDFFDVPASVFVINTGDPPNYGDHLNNTALMKMNMEKDGKAAEKTKARQPTAPAMMEIDLHIHEIIEDQHGLSDGEILDLQLKRFETALETAIRSKTKKVVFIHGVGQGRLKFEMTKILGNKYPDLRYQDASFKEYGYGATMVFL
jgi:dsDNA-specific endonuclease/ATPase MutS2